MDPAGKKDDIAAIWMSPDKDQVAIARQALCSGQRVRLGGLSVGIRQAVAPGHRFAVRDIPRGEYVRQFGYAFGRSKGIKAGELITGRNMMAEIPEVSFKEFRPPEPTKYSPDLLAKRFLGYHRKDGRVGTRNFYLVVPTSMCASETCAQIARQAGAIVPKGAGLDGVVAIPHTEGCGCDAGVSIERLLRVLHGYIDHPNVGGCLVVDLGCEQTSQEVVRRFMKDILRRGGKPVDWLTIEQSGGVKATQRKAAMIIGRRLPAIARQRRKPAGLDKLILGTECGASDSFSGVTANPLIGYVADQVIGAKGAAILSEIPEMVGTMPMLMARFRSREVARKFQEALRWYEDLARRMGGDLADNLVPKNIEGGLVNAYIKSLGAVLKGGTTVIEDVIGYAAPVSHRGLSIMQGPGGDLESVTGLVASGANLICFSTGYGTPTGNAICPVIKVASNPEVFRRLSGDLDFNGGRLLSGEIGLEKLGDELLALVLRTCSGQLTASEKLGQRQFQVWTAGKLSL